MQRGSWSYGLRASVTVPGHGGFTDVAHDLSRRPPYRTVSRQAVYSWWVHKGGNGCPDRHEVDVNGVIRLLFRFDEMRRWYGERVGIPYEEPVGGEENEVPRDELDDVSP